MTKQQEEGTKIDPGVFKNKMEYLGYSPRTIRNYMGAVEEWRVHGWDTKELIETYRKRGMSGRSVNAKLAAVKLYLNWDGRYKEAKAIGRARESSGKRQRWTFKTLKMVAVQEPSHLHRVAMETLLYTGLRVSELCQLTGGDFERGQALIVGKGDKDRVVPLPEMNVKARGEELVFDVAESTIFRWIRKAGRDHMISPLSPHDFRHAYATEMIKQGYSISNLKELLGHTDIQTTMNYLHPTHEDLVGVGKDFHKKMGIAS